MPRPVHVEIQASDPDAVRTFYESVFGWRFQQWGDVPYWLVITGDGDPLAGQAHSRPGVDGGLLPRRGERPQDGQPVNAFVMTVDVPDCDAYVARAAAAGGSLAVPAADLPGVGRPAYVQDPDGNLFGLLQFEAAVDEDGRQKLAFGTPTPGSIRTGPLADGRTSKSKMAVGM
jgi:predicted enzyme related to lactoylglutathione lyase